MNRIKTILIGAALVAASSALASAQPNNDRHEGRYEDRDNYRGRDNRARDNDRRFDRDRDDHRNFRDRDDRRFDRDDRRFHDRDDYRFRVGERRFFNGYYWDWDGNRWCRRDHGLQIYLRF